MSFSKYETLFSGISALNTLLELGEYWYCLRILIKAPGPFNALSWFNIPQPYFSSGSVTIFLIYVSFSSIFVLSVVVNKVCLTWSAVIQSYFSATKAAAFATLGAAKDDPLCVTPLLSTTSASAEIAHHLAFPGYAKCAVSV